MTNPCLELFNLSFYSVWPWSIWLSLFQLTCSIFQLLINLPWIISLASLQIQSGGHHPSYTVLTRSHVSYSWMSLWRLWPIKSLWHILTCVQLLPILDTVLAKIVSENTGCAMHWQQRWQSFFLNPLYNEDWSIVQISLCIVAWVVFWAFYRVIPHC